MASCLRLLVHHKYYRSRDCAGHKCCTWRKGKVKEGHKKKSWNMNRKNKVKLMLISQRRVTFHLPDGSQESCSDSGLGDHEPVGSGSLLTQPLPLVQAQDDFYEQASPDKRTEADGNSDPNSG
ncbi:hypothetical protein PAMP_000367 [Pampus punctatissimus]